MKTCPHCHASVGEDWRFCRHCGTPLRAPDDVPTQIIESTPETAAARGVPTGPAYVAPEIGSPTSRSPLSPAAKRSRFWIAGLLLGLVVLSVGVGGSLFWLREHSRHRLPIVWPERSLSQPAEGAGENLVEHEVAFPPNGILRVKNINGDIEIKTSDGNRARIAARIEGSFSSVGSSPVSIISRGPELIVETKTEGGAAPEIHYEIVLPRSAHLRQVSTVNGAIRVEGVQGRIEASTVNGEIELLDVGGDISTEAVNGETRVDVRAGVNLKGITLKTLNGDIRLTLPEPVSADFLLQTLHGEITFDPSFPLTVTQLRLIGGKKAVGKMSAGEVSIHMETVNGSIILSR
jgi:hypothetical protein